MRTITNTSERSAAAAALGSIRTEKKAAAARQNGRLAPPGPGRPARPLETYECTCGGEDLDHKATCPRGAAIRRRMKAGTL